MFALLDEAVGHRLRDARGGEVVLVTLLAAGSLEAGGLLVRPGVAQYVAERAVGVAFAHDELEALRADGGNRELVGLRADLLALRIAGLERQARHADRVRAGLRGLLADPGDRVREVQAGLDGVDALVELDHDRLDVGHDDAGGVVGRRRRGRDVEVGGGGRRGVRGDREHRQAGHDQQQQTGQRLHDTLLLQVHSDSDILGAGTT